MRTRNFVRYSWIFRCCTGLRAWANSAWIDDLVNHGFFLHFCYILNKLAKGTLCTCLQLFMNYQHDCTMVVATDLLTTLLCDAIKCLSIMRCHWYRWTGNYNVASIFDSSSKKYSLPTKTTISAWPHMCKRCESERLLRKTVESGISCWAQSFCSTRC